ncbi:MAG TPA: bifunctional lysylphosphatidylglycerol synthetase/lysine--tRNA ligase LysX [Candidatus Corynebacterium gallistercoris]|uniref:Bifunctional lysylphosphatidylglycerol synthetase/lysine--tRNA ligase LysX n=1 Tax=Candidatus Corynebacterium gallistercoris TaxID=2838530 RepID=A0A9D1RZU4_9CORY|nr:bifunctional lysylphosphatidylglycerol synthetase/lysine--tRNA ligase LysX [Candidatus Corynebacterium gallistercoris]
MNAKTSNFPRTAGTFVCLYALLSLALNLAHYFNFEPEYFELIVSTLFLPLPSTSLAWSLVLFMLGVGLYRSKRVAWLVATAFLTLLNIVNVVDIVLLVTEVWEAEASPDFFTRLFYWGAVIQGVLLLVFLVKRRSFAASTVGGAFRRALTAWVIGVACVFAIATALVFAFPGSLQGSSRILWVLSHSVVFSLVDARHLNGNAPLEVELIVAVLAAAVLLTAGLILLRSQHDQNSMAARDEEAIRGMVGRFNANDSLAYFATRRDKSVVFEPKGRAAVTYRVEGGVCLASADPIGDPDHWDAAVRAWLDRAEKFGWMPATIGTSERGARVFERFGLRSIHLGDEAVIDTSQIHLSELKEIRQARSHAQKAGVTVTVRRHEMLSEEELQQVQRLADEWRDTTEERGFSMALGRLGDPADGSCILVEAHIQDKPVGLLSFAPWGPNGASLDLMRRSPDAPNGTVETMVAELCMDESITRVSLNFAVFRKLFASEDAVGVSRIQHASRSVLTYLSKWWQMESLYRSNQKYEPLWVPRYLCTPSSLSLARVGIAAGIAEGFLSGWPVSSRRRHAAAEQPEAILAIEHVRRADVVQKKRYSEQTAVRISKAHALQAEGVDPWPEATRPSHAISAVSSLPRGTHVRVAGRVTARRAFGGVTFADLRDASGSVQILQEGPLLVDLGDLIAVSGTVGHSRNGTLSVLVDSWTMEAKSLHPLQRRGAGIVELNAKLQARSAVLTAFRQELVQAGYAEVETPVLQAVHGGANARPFVTHINAYNQDLYLRIAPELYLKRLLSGGAERIFEMGRVFRNEGVDTTHNPEFTVLEAYDAHGNYDTMRVLTQTLIQKAAKAVNGEEVVVGPDGRKVSIAGDWPVKTVHGAVSENASKALGRDVEVTPDTGKDALAELCAELEIPVKPTWDSGEIVLEMYEHLVEDTTQEPTFYTDFPTSVSPLTRKHRSIEGVTERWDLVAWGVELGTAYSELTDPLEQRARLEAQSLKAAGGDPEAMEVDESFLQALENGMPPTGGLGIGVDRVIMLITGKTIREALAFPLTT